MSAQIIPFPVRVPSVGLGVEAEKLAEIVYRRGHESGREITMEHARRAVLKALNDSRP